MAVVGLVLAGLVAVGLFVLWLVRPDWQMDLLGEALDDAESEIVRARSWVRRRRAPRRPGRGRPSPKARS